MWPDDEIAQRLGRKTWEIRWRRRQLGIPICYLKPRWPQHELALLGVLPDEEVARLTGHTVAAVAMKRHLLGRPKSEAVMAYSQ